MKQIRSNRCLSIFIAAAVSLSLCSSIAAEVLPGMTSLQNGQAADADDVNQNFELLSGQSLTNE